DKLMFLSRGYLRNSEDPLPRFFPVLKCGKFVGFSLNGLAFPFLPIFPNVFDATALPQGFNRRTTSLMVMFCNTRSTAESTSDNTSPRTVSIFTPTGQSRLGGCRCKENTPPYSSA